MSGAGASGPWGTGGVVGMPAPGDSPYGLVPLAHRGDDFGSTAHPGPPMTRAACASQRSGGERVQRRPGAAWASAVAGGAGSGIDGPSVDHLVAWYRGPLYGHILGLVGDPAQAADLT